MAAKHRDLLFVLLLVAMVKVALTKKELPRTNPIIFAPANHTESEKEHQAQLEHAEEMEAEDTVDEEAEGMVFHQPDKEALSQLASLKDRVEKLLSLSELSYADKEELKEIQIELPQLQKEYETTSPAIVLLGPIGSAGIVLKEQRLEEKLAHHAQKITSLENTASNNL